KCKRVVIPNGVAFFINPQQLTGSTRERLKNNTPNSETLSITQQKITIITATTTYNLMTVLMEIVSKKNIE
ncbi:hypothetical protein, partial [Vibrio parahaemolyticus]|uniref:hypothetical protein n=1 Tax=Vibrio parahaemolyticus TaxID=670 RepID=UPI001C6110A0